MSNEYSDNVHFSGANAVGTINEVKLHADLVQRGLQTRVRAIMAIYGIEREEAVKVLEEMKAEMNQYGRPTVIPFPDQIGK